MNQHARNHRRSARGGKPDDGAVAAPPKLVFGFLMLGVIAGALIAPGERGPLGTAIANAIGLPGGEAQPQPNNAPAPAIDRSPANRAAESERKS